MPRKTNGGRVMDWRWRGTQSGKEYVKNERRKKKMKRDLLERTGLRRATEG
jgi:hypothetical protein